MKKVFVTGGNGFIGSHLVERLIESGYQVNALVRQKSDLSFLPIEKINLVKGDLNNVESLNAGMQGCRIIFHAAAKVSDWGKYEEFYQNNVTGTINVLAAAKANGINKVILISSNAVLGEENNPLPKPETAPYNPIMPYFMSNIIKSDMNHYRQTKMLSEKEAIEYARKNNINLTVLRPVWVYGPREFNAGPYKFCQSLLRGIRFFPAGANKRFHVIYVKDLAAAVILAAEKNLKGINIYNLGNPKPPESRQYLNLYCRHLGVKHPIYTPLYLLYPFGVLLEFTAKLLRLRRPLTLTRARAKMFYCHNVYDVTKAEKELGFKAFTPLEDGIKETVQWWRENGFLNKDYALKQKYVAGISRTLLDLRMGVVIISRYLLRLLKRDITLKKYFHFIRRIFIFAKVLKNYKTVKINNRYKTHIYLAAYPSRAFFRAIDKFLLLDGETVASHVVLSMTKSCAYNCPHCYQKNDGGLDTPLDKLIKTAKSIQDIGITMFDIEGGEPLLRFDRLTRLLKSLDDRSELWINTTGHTLTNEKARLLKQAGLFGAMISIHHWDAEKHDIFVGKKGAFEIAKTAIKMFQRAGVTTAINSVPSLETISDHGIERIMDLARELNCSFVQIIHEKSSGGWLFRNSSLDTKLLQDLRDKHTFFNTKNCNKDYPSLTVQVFESCHEAFGCTAGGIERFYINAAGEVQPCEFLNVSLGNINEDDFMSIYNNMRINFKKPGLKWLCNTERSSIANCAGENRVTSFPIKKEKTIPLIAQWDKGEEVPLFKKMKICEKL